MILEKAIHKCVFVLNPSENGGEALSLETIYYNNGDNDLFTNQKLTLQSYCNSASFELVGATLDSKTLRALADKLDKEEDKAKKSMLKG
jgi:hypothetical protein